MLTLSVIARALLLKLPDANPQRARCRHALDWFPWRSICRFRVAAGSDPLEVDMTTETEVAAKEDHIRIIQTRYNRLLNCLTSVGDIIAELFQKEYLTTLELEYLQSFESTPIRANAELLNVIMKKSSEVYENFLICLMNSKQQDAYLLLTTRSQGRHFTNSEHHRLIREHYDWLANNIDCDMGLIARLFEMGVLTNREYEYVGAKSDRFKKNEALLSIICRKSSEDFVHFQEALIETGQSAVVNELKRFPASEVKRSNESDEHRLIIQRNFYWLTETIEPNNGLIHILYQNKVITFRERETFSAERDVVKTNESLLKIISQKSPTDFEQFKNALSETKQDHVIQKLTEEGSNMSVEVFEKQVTDEPVSNQHPVKSTVLPKRVQDDGPKIHEKTNVSAGDRSCKAETQKIRSLSCIKSSFEKLENSSQIEIFLKVASLQQQNPASQNSFQECVKTILEGSPELLITMKRKQKEEKLISQRRELEKERLNSELKTVTKALPEEETLKYKTEDQNKKINEMYERMKRKFQQQTSRSEEEMNSIKIENGTLSSLLKKEKEHKESAEQDLQEERKTVCTLKRQLDAAEEEIEQHSHRTSLLAGRLDELRKELLQIQSDLGLSTVKNHDLEIEIEKYKGDITAEGNRSSQLAQSLHLFAEEFSVSTNTFLSLETEHLHNVMKKIMDLEKKVKYATEKTTFNEKMKSSVVKKFEELRIARSELDSMKEEKHRLENSIEMFKSDLNEADKRSEEGEHFLTEMLRNLEKSMTDCFSLETDRLNMAVNKIVDSGKKLNLIEENIASIRKNIANDELWTSIPRLIRTIEAKNENRISGVAISDQELFIASRNTPEIYVYDLSALCVRSVFQIDGLSDPDDLAFCKTKNCLYITDIRTEEIIRSTTKGKILKRWPTEVSCDCISVAFDSHIIFTSRDENLIVEYTPEGKEVRRIKVSKEAGLVHPTHSIKLRSGCFLVNHGAFWDPLRKVCIIDVKGQVLMAFGGVERSDIKSLSWHRHMAIKSDGSIILTDWANDRLLLLDANLKFKRVLIPPKMHKPHRLAVDESTGRLFVVQGDGTSIQKQVSVYKFCQCFK